MPAASMAAGCLHWIFSSQISPAHTINPWNTPMKTKAAICRKSGDRTKRRNLFVPVYFQLQNGNEDNAAHPDSQVGVKRSHAGAVVLHRIEGFRLNFSRRGHKEETVSASMPSSERNFWKESELTMAFTSVRTVFKSS